MFSVQELQARSLQVVKACHNQTSSLWFEPNFIYCDFLCAHCVKAVWWITSESDLCAFREWNLNSLKSIQQKNMCTLIFFFYSKLMRPLKSICPLVRCGKRVQAIQRADLLGLQNLQIILLKGTRLQSDIRQNTLHSNVPLCQQSYIWFESLKEINKLQNVSTVQ